MFRRRVDLDCEFLDRGARYEAFTFPKVAQSAQSLHHLTAAATLRLVFWSRDRRLELHDVRNVSAAAHEYISDTNRRCEIWKEHGGPFARPLLRRTQHASECLTLAQ